jgi:hypothetical protein
MERNQVEELIDEKIKHHEIRVGLISGIIGFFFTFGIVHSIWLMKKIIELGG